MFKQKGFGTPAAIVVAGLVIALAIALGGNGKGNEKVQNMPEVASATSITEVAKDLGIKEKDFEKCISDPKSLAKVTEDIDGVSSIASQQGFGTPYNVVIDTQTGLTIPVVGAQPYANVEKLIDLILSDDPTVNDIAVDLDIPSITIEGDHTNGNADARIQIVEYSDFDCPFCGRFHETMNQVMAKYGESGDVAWTYRHFPLEQIHPQAKAKAVASECVADLGGNDKFWEFSNIMFGM